MYYGCIYTVCRLNKMKIILSLERTSFTISIERVEVTLLFGIVGLYDTGKVIAIYCKITEPQ